MTKTLPDKLSDTIDLALVDLVKAEKSPGYAVEMCEWHNPTVSGICEVCLAGSVMAFTLGVTKDDSCAPSSLDQPLDGKLSALEEIRCGDIYSAIYEFYRTNIESADIPKKRRVIGYSTDPEGFKQELRDIATMLRKEGL